MDEFDEDYGYVIEGEEFDYNEDEYSDFRDYSDDDEDEYNDYGDEDSEKTDEPDCIVSSEGSVSSSRISFSVASNFEDDHTI